MKKLDKRGWAIVGSIGALVVLGLVLWQSGYGPEIGKFFAYEQPSGYVPYCTGYGQLVTYDNDGQQFPSCCAGLIPQNVPEAQGSSFCIPPSCTATYEQHECFTTPCDPVVNVICPTESPNPNATAELYISGNSGVAQSVTPGQRLYLPVTMNTGGAKVTAVDVVFEAGEGAHFAGFSYGTPDFPEVLRAGTVSDLQVDLAVGSGPNGGHSGAALDVATLTVDIDPNVRVGTHIHIITLNAEIAAEGAQGSVLRLGSYADLVVAAKGTKLGDLDGDGDVDIYDYNILVSNFGK